MLPDERRLRDILAAAEELGDYLDGVTADGLAGDRLRQRAVERLLTIIGEAAKQTSPATRDRIAQPWREIIRFRDKGIHAYDALTPSTLHAIATTSVPELAAAVRGFLAQA